jgi:tetratricopeptide (TPR) repeat protein
LSLTWREQNDQCGRFKDRSPQRINAVTVLLPDCLLHKSSDRRGRSRSSRACQGSGNSPQLAASNTGSSAARCRGAWSRWRFPRLRLQRSNSTKSHGSFLCKAGLRYEKKGDYDRAIADYSGAIRLNPNFAPAFWQSRKGEAEMNDSSGNVDIAKARQLDPSSC